MLRKDRICHLCGGETLSRMRPDFTFEDYCPNCDGPWPWPWEGLGGGLPMGPGGLPLPPIGPDGNPRY